MQLPGPNIFSLQTDEGRYNVVSFASPADVAARGIPQQAIIGVLPPSVVAIEQSTIKLNASFVSFLHMVIAKHGPSSPTLIAEAIQIDHGALAVKDARASTDGGQEPEDVFGVFQVRDGRIILNSYQPNPDYLMVSKKGLFVLNVYLHSRLLEELAKL